MLTNTVPRYNRDKSRGKQRTLFGGEIEIVAHLNLQLSSGRNYFEFAVPKGYDTWTNVLVQNLPFAVAVLQTHLTQANADIYALGEAHAHALQEIDVSRSSWWLFF